MPSSDPAGLRPLAARVLVGFLLFAVVFGLLEYSARRAPTSFRLKRLGAGAAAARTQVLVLGPSVSFNGVDPAAWVFPGYNLADNAQTLYYDQALLRLWAPRMPSLRTVLVGLAYASLRTSVDSLSETARAFAYAREFGIPDEDPADRWDLRNVSAALALGPFKVLEYAFNGDGLVLGGVTPLGFGPLPALDPDQADLQLSSLAAQEIAQQQGARMVLPPEYGLAHLRAILTYCKVRGLRAGIFVPPVSAGFAGVVDAAAWKSDRGGVEKLCADEGARFHDYFSDPRFGDADFSDVDHLDSSAAERFSRILAVDFRLPDSPASGRD